MNYWDIIFKIIEALSNLGTVAVAVLAYISLRQIKIGLEQIKIAKDTSKLNSQRDSIKAANEAIANFFNIILPKDEEQKITTDERTLLKSLEIDSSGKINFEAIVKTSEELEFGTEKGRNAYKIKLRKAFEKKRVTFNLVESFSTFFMSRLADEEIAYKALGLAFYGLVKDFEKILTYYNQEGFYNNTIALYDLWLPWTRGGLARV